MTSFDLVNMAVVNALNTAENVAVSDAHSRLTEAVFMAEQTLLAFYQLAQKRPDILSEPAQSAWEQYLAQSEQLLTRARTSSGNSTEMQAICQRFQFVLSETRKLLLACQYKAAADEVIGSRLYRADRPGLRFDEKSSREEIRELLFSRRRAV